MKEHYDFSDSKKNPYVDHIHNDGKQELSILLDADIIDFFQKNGKNYEAKINSILRSYVEHKRRA